jgi:UDP-N-acetylglucosamine:LPS N-acetylglucosamine transferase
LLIPDQEATKELVPLILQLAQNNELRNELGAAVRTLAVRNAAPAIAQYILKHSYA